MSETSARKLSHKTDAIMRLLTGSNLAVNPMLDNEFKQSVIEMRSYEHTRRREKTPEEIQRENAEREKKIKHTSKPAVSEEPVEICVSSELITELLPQAMKRFKCCMCDKCFAEAMTDALEVVPSVSVKVHGESDVKRAEEIREHTRNDVMRILVRIAISRRGKPVHTN